ncbi:MAG TPA: hypothetical protein VFE62_19350, partial [Gemmataceae bacterium]|nr:hypothetical protein [Gemmataceae bacterium]
GDAGVDRALEVFVSQDLDLRIATLPEGLDPCDLIVAQGPAPFQQALEQAIDVFEYKLQSTWAKHKDQGTDGLRRAADEMLGILALTPTERSVKLDLMINRIAQRLLIKEETVWARLKELRAARKAKEAREQQTPATAASARGNAQETAAAPKEPPSAPAMSHERELLEVLLAEPALVARAAAEIPSQEVEHPGLRKVIEALYRLHAEGHPADLDHLHGVMDNERLLDRLHELRAIGLDLPDRPWVYQKVLERFRERGIQRSKQALLNQLQNAPDDASKLAILKQLKDLKTHGNPEQGRS